MTPGTTMAVVVTAKVLARLSREGTRVNLHIPCDPPRGSPRRQGSDPIRSRKDYQGKIAMNG